MLITEVQKGTDALPMWSEHRANFLYKTRSWKTLRTLYTSSPDASSMSHLNVCHLSLCRGDSTIMDPLSREYPSMPSLHSGRSVLNSDTHTLTFSLTHKDVEVEEGNRVVFWDAVKIIYFWSWSLIRVYNPTTAVGSSTESDETAIHPSPSMKRRNWDWGKPGDSWWLAWQVEGARVMETFIVLC